MIDLEYTLSADLHNPDSLKMIWDDIHAVATLQGIVNRRSPRLYIFLVKNGRVDIDRYWWNKYRGKGKWLSGRDTVLYPDVGSMINAYRHEIKGAVVYDPKVPATSNVASSVAGIEDVIALRYDTTPGSLYSRLVMNGPRLPVKIWLLHSDGSPLFTGKGNVPGTDRPSSGSAKDDAYLWFLEHYMKKGRCNTAYAAYYIDQQWMKKPAAAARNHHTLSNHDFFVSRRGFFFDLSPWGDEPATDDPHQQPGTDRKTLKELLLTAYRQNRGQRFCYIGGFPPWAFKYTRHAGGRHEDVETEWEYSRIISAYNAFKDADAINYGALANASFWQHFPLKSKYPQPWITPQELQRRGYLTRDGQIDFRGRNFIIFYVGDYDASSWLSQTTPDLWDDPDRGKVPLMWCISPVLAERVPMAMDYRRETATPNDYFAAADNGAGYLMPGMLQEPRPISGLPEGLQAWVAHNKPYYDRWGLSITGFIIDGKAPGLNKKGLDAYAQFSGNGIVPQKVPLTLLHGNMPVLRSDDDVNETDPAAAARHILARVKARPVPFHWFRNILKSPTWYVQVAEELKRLDPKIELLDAPAFFELYRIYLEEGDRGQ
ncbi:GxGYxYP family putative glycoside hydrolase [Compostibacter hankyongensis]|uniref:GxGYxYP family putative glycoside hydrolase n=2 Tax=Compostibacter hankyongensis TaxID=1007089 RepID=A0ABP8FV66_9BACT